MITSFRHKPFNHFVYVINTSTAVIECVLLLSVSPVRKLAIMLVEVVWNHVGTHEVCWFPYITIHM